MILKIVVKIIMVKRNHLKCVDGFGFIIMPLIIFRYNLTYNCSIFLV